MLDFMGIPQPDEAKAEALTYAERERQRKARSTRGASSQAQSLPFVGIDGEGGGQGRDHAYLLLRAGSHVLETGRPLTWQECLAFIADLPKDAVYVGYFFDYDVTMMLKGLPPDRIRRLLNRASRTPTKMGRGATAWPVDVEGFQIDYLPGREFKCRRAGSAQWTVVSDVGAFFQCAFIKTLQDWDIGSPEQKADIQAGKDARAEFGVMTDEIRAYNRLEIDLLEQLMSKFRATCIGIGYVPRVWQGPGRLAETMFRRHGVTRTSKLSVLRNRDLVRFCNSAYYGGRFETTACGPVHGPVYAYDINSAYPDALTKLPCLEHGRWLETGDRPGPGLYIAYGQFSPLDDALLYGFPFRRPNGSIHFPGAGAGWYWSTEIDASIHQRFVPTVSYTYEAACSCQPFSWVPSLYEQRRKLGKESRGKVLKLGLNSLYGKMVQSIGSPAYANPIWGSLITALTRAKLQTLIHSQLDCAAYRNGGHIPCGANVVMLATDGVFTTTPFLTPIDKNLGGWDLTTHDNGIFIVQPGLYFTSDKMMPKTRGVPRAKVIDKEAEFRAAFDTLCQTNSFEDAIVRIPLESFIGLRLAAHRNKFADAGTWQRITDPDGRDGKGISFDWRNKRQDSTRRQNGYILTRPYPGSVEDVTTPYGKDIGALLNDGRMPYLDQPDHSPAFLLLDEIGGAL